MLLALLRHLLEPLESLPLVLAATRDDGVAGGFEVVVFEHDVAGQDMANLALTPSSVYIHEVLGRDTAGLQVLGIPGGETLGHGALDEAVRGGLAAELELERLAQGLSGYIVGLVAD